MLVIALALSIPVSVLLAVLLVIDSTFIFEGGLPDWLLYGLNVLIALPAVTLSVWIARRALDRRSFSSFGLEVDSQSFRDLIAGALIPAPLFALAFLTLWALGWLELDGWGWENASLTITLLGVLLGLIGFLAVGFYEELLFRGYYLQNLRDGTGLALALFLSSALFGLAHLGNFSASVASTLGIFGAGYFLAFGWMRTRGLWLPIGLHVGWNFFQGPIFGFAVSGLPTPAVVVHSVVGPEIITGGGFGPEAGFIVLPMLGLGALLVWLYTRGRSGIAAQDPDS